MNIYIIRNLKMDLKFFINENKIFLRIEQDSNMNLKIIDNNVKFIKF